jgi:hypothetical protein
MGAIVTFEHHNPLAQKMTFKPATQTGVPDAINLPEMLLGTAA